MKITIEDEYSSVTIDNQKDGLTTINAVRLCKRALLGLSYQLKSIDEAMDEVGNNE